MGAPTLPPSAIARTFLAIYYEVAVQNPHDMQDFYNERSQLTHGSVSARGQRQIGAVSAELPVHRGPPILHSIDAQHTEGGLVVLVAGTIQGELFTQCFVLEKQPAEQGHFHYEVANDVFRTVSLVPDETIVLVPHGTPQFDRVDKPANTNSPQTIVETPVSAPAAAPVSGKPTSATGNKDDVDVALPASNAGVHDVALPPDNGVSLPPDNGVALPPDNGVALPPDNGVALPPDNVPSDTGVHLPLDNTPPVALPADNGHPRNAEVPKKRADAPPKPRAAPKPKTWASIVSKPGGNTAGGNTVQIFEAPPKPLSEVNKAPLQPAIVNAVPAPVPAPAPPTNTDTRANATQRKEKVPAAAPAPASTAAPTAAAAPTPAGGGGGGGKFGYKGAARQFGPSAVLQLASCGASWAGKPRELSSALREEFGQYGHAVRHVEVKQNRGIIFVEYDTIEGVEAAVKAWKEPRAEGRFAGVPLAVSEKRHIRRPAQYYRGRGGGPRRGARSQHTAPAE